MSYRRSLLTRFSRRDYLSMAIVSVTVAFLTGSALLFVAGTAQTQAISTDFNSPGTVSSYDTVEAARSDHPNEAVLTTAQATLGGTPVTVVSGSSSDLLANVTPKRGVAAVGANVSTAAIDGANHTTTVRITNRSSAGPVPDRWYVANQSLVDRLGPDGAIVVNTTDGGSTVPTRGAAAFFVEGSRQALSLFGLLAAGVSILVAVVVFSVTRMSVRDRRQTIRVVRATGGTAGRLRLLFAARAALISVVGVALGYAVGLIATRTAVNIGVFIGLPVSLDVSLEPATLSLLIPLYVGLLALGATAGYIAAWPATRGPPAADSTSRTASRLSLLRWRSVVPTAATAAVFLTLLLVLVAIVSAVGPVATAGTATIAEPGVPHPVASDVPEAYAAVLADRGIDASPEIFLFSTVDGRPLLARGVDYQAFANVTAITLDEGSPPNASDGAVIGVDAARLHGIEVGDMVTIGGSTRSSLARVHVVGTFEAPGLYDDQLLVSLSTARSLSTRGPQSVHVVRASRLPSTGDGAVTVTSVDAPATVVANRSVEVSVTAVNLGRESLNREVMLSLGNTETTVSLSPAPGERQTETATLATPEPGKAVLRAGERNRTVAVLAADTPTLSFPSPVPSGRDIPVVVTTPTGTPLANATVAVDGQRSTTDADGRTRLRAPPPGSYALNVTANGQRRTASLTVLGPDAPRRPQATLSVDPETPTLQTTPTATLQLSNPYDRPLSTTVTIEGPQTTGTHTVDLSPGETQSVSTTLARNPPGEYELSATTADGTVLTKRSLSVSGSSRLVAALATRGQRTSTPVAQAIATVFGNLQILVAVVVGLGGVMTVGGLTATFARGVHSRRRTVGIYRATGASDWRILRVVLGDALRIALVATAVAFVVGYVVLIALSTAGLLAAFGVVIEPVLSLRVVAAGTAAVLGLTCLGATLATVSLLRQAPAATLSTDTDRGDHR